MKVILTCWFIQRESLHRGSHWIFAVWEGLWGSAWLNTLLRIYEVTRVKWGHNKLRNTVRSHHIFHRVLCDVILSRFIWMLQWGSAWETRLNVLFKTVPHFKNSSKLVWNYIWNSFVFCILFQVQNKKKQTKNESKTEIYCLLKKMKN